jgi:hypothetical protein
MIIIGAGMAGLLAATVLRSNCYGIIEAQPELPSNHSAVLRFKSPIVGDTCNIPFRKVRALKSTLRWKNPLLDAMAYSNKSNGDYRLRSIITADDSVVERYVAPPDFTAQLVERLNCAIDFNCKANNDWLVRTTGPIISTLPMPVLMDLLNYTGPRPAFKSINGVNVMAKISDCNMHCSLYLPDPKLRPYRVSINGDRLIAEVSLLTAVEETDFHAVGSDERLADLWREHALNALEIPRDRTSDYSHQFQSYMKILPIDEAARLRFIIWATEKFNIYSLGRFATWRPAVLLDDIVQDVRLIQRMVGMSNYEQRKAI